MQGRLCAVQNDVLVRQDHAVFAEDHAAATADAAINARYDKHDALARIGGVQRRVY